VKLAARLAYARIARIVPLVVALALSTRAHAQPAAPPRPKPAARPSIAQAPSAARSIVYTSATVHTGTGEVLADTSVVVVDGKIAEVGRTVVTPPGAQTIGARGMVITPGFVDALTSVGLVEIDLEEATHDDALTPGGGGDPIRAGFRAADGYNPASVAIPVVRAEGITSVGVEPHGGLVSGLSAWADLDGRTAAEALAAPALALHVRLGGGDGGHAAAILRVREAFDDARAFQKNRAAWERNATRRFAPSRVDLEALAGALDGKLPVVFHVDRGADILSALALARELKLRPVIAGGAEAWKVARELAAAKVPVVVYPLQQLGSFDSLGAREDNAAQLFAAGVAVGIASGETQNARKLRQCAGNAVRAGLPHEAAIAAVTRVPAEALGMGARYGTLARGKVANLVLWSGDPLELSTRVVDVVIRGQRVSLRSRQTVLLEKYRHLGP
jgi:imidazolonepropionase-like amidohydrolase